MFMLACVSGTGLSAKQAATDDPSSLEIAPQQGQQAHDERGRDERGAEEAAPDAAVAVPRRPWPE